MIFYKRNPVVDLGEEKREKEEMTEGREIFLTSKEM